MSLKFVNYITHIRISRDIPDTDKTQLVQLNFVPFVVLISSLHFNWLIDYYSVLNCNSTGTLYIRLQIIVLNHYINFFNRQSVTVYVSFPCCFSYMLLSKGNGKNVTNASFDRRNRGSYYTPDSEL